MIKLAMQIWQKFSVTFFSTKSLALDSYQITQALAMLCGQYLTLNLYHFFLF